MAGNLNKLLLLLVLTASLSVPVLAAPSATDAEVLMPEVTAPPTSDSDYSGLLDPRTGLPYEEKTDAEEDASYVTLQEGSFGYDKDKRCYDNIVGYASFSSNIPNGAVLSRGETVSVDLRSGLSGTLYRDGDLVSEANLASITDVGSYILEVRSSSGEQVSFSFEILGEMTNSLTELSLPAGFAFDYIAVNGEELGSEYSNYTELWENGEYEIRWSCEAIDQYYTLSFTLDTEAPTLTLPEVTGGEAHSKVTLTDMEEGCYALLESADGTKESIFSSTHEIKDAGTYHLTVYDQAGNFTEYDFVIHVYLNLSALAALGLIAGAILGLFLYGRYVRKHPRVG